MWLYMKRAVECGCICHGGPPINELYERAARAIARGREASVRSVIVKLELGLSHCKMAEATGGLMRTYEYLRARSALTDALNAAAYRELESDGQSHDEFLTNVLALQRAVTEAEARDEEEARRYRRAGKPRKKARTSNVRKQRQGTGALKLGSNPR